VIAVLIPSFTTIEDAIDFVVAHGEPIRIILQRGQDGMIRGNATVRKK
jgi:hypothetical protein